MLGELVCRTLEARLTTPTGTVTSGSVTSPDHVPRRGGEHCRRDTEIHFGESGVPEIRLIGFFDGVCVSALVGWLRG